MCTNVLTNWFKMWIRTTLLVLLILDCGFGIFTPVVKVSQGKLRGLRSVSGQNRYYGIPYAVSKRFQPPQPPLKWDGILNAVNRFTTCAQTVSFLEMGSEECLQLDVFAPAAAGPGARRPVLVWIHGGGYYYGSKWHYDPEFLVQRNVVVVTINYRLGVFGFLCLDGISNLGLKDQVSALKWIRKNIAAFGGDPDNVTLSGQSAGAAAAAMHMLSRSSAGLFHKLILLSGTPFAPWAFNIEHDEAAMRDARKIRDASNDESVLDIFATATMKEILNATRDTSINPRRFKYAPCIDANFTAAFFHDTPYGAITSGEFNKVPIISGFTSAEGMLFYGLHDDKTLREWDENFVERLPAVFACEADRARIGEELRAHYFAGGRISAAAERGVVDFYSDWLAYSTAEGFASLLTRFSDRPLYQYIFSYEGGRNFATRLFFRGHEVRGASHSDDIFYMFKPGGLSTPLSARDQLFIGRLAAIFTDFMKFGEPSPAHKQRGVRGVRGVRWARTTANRSRALQLGGRLELVAGGGRARLMRDLLCRHGAPGYVPCAPAASCAATGQA